VGLPEQSSPLQTGSRSVFISDVHLGYEPEESERSVTLRKFLARLPDDGVSDLYVLGDLFDFWFEYRSVVLSANFPVLRALAELHDSGVRLHYVVGNHDCWAGPFMENVIGFSVYKEPVAVEISGTRVFLCHGDGLNLRDYGARAFRAISRWRVAIALFRAVHPDLAMRFGRMVSGLSRQLVNAETPGRLREAEAVRRYALRKLRNGDVDMVLAGHCHVPTDTSIEVDGRTKRYINVGDWLTHFTYAELSQGEIVLKRFGGDASDLE